MDEEGALCWVWIDSYWFIGADFVDGGGENRDLLGDVHSAVAIDD